MIVVRALLASAIDYAGTFPPARLSLEEALRSYAAYRAGPHDWLLGRFILSAAQLAEFEELAPGVLPAADGKPWPLSLIVSADPGPEVARLEALARRWEGKVRVASVEAPPLEAARIGEVAAQLPRGLDAYFEVPLGADLDARLEAIAACGAGAKVRTGGLSEAAFPGTGELARFILGCARVLIPFKATAGLHHAWRGPRPLDTGPGSPQAAMHGYLNLAIAAALVHAGRAGLEETAAVLAETDRRAFSFTAYRIEWRGRGLYPAELATSQRGFFRSFGACSFDEPARELEESGLA